MTETLVAVAEREEQVPGPRTWSRAQDWYRFHRASLLVLGRVLAVVGVLTAWNMQGWPGWADDD